MQRVVEIQRQTPFGSQVVLAEHIEIIVQRLAGTQVASQLQAQRRHFGGALEVRASAARTDPWNVEYA